MIIYRQPIITVYTFRFLNKLSFVKQADSKRLIRIKNAGIITCIQFKIVDISKDLLEIIYKSQCSHEYSVEHDLDK